MFTKAVDVLRGADVYESGGCPARRGCLRKRWMSCEARMFTKAVNVLRGADVYESGECPKTAASFVTPQSFSGPQPLS